MRLLPALNFHLNQFAVSQQRLASLLGAVGYATQASLFFSALRLMDASLLALILYTYPVMVTVAAVLLGRDRLTARRGAALLAASGGTLLVLLGARGGSFHPLGALLGFASAVTYTVYILVADTVVHRLAPVVLSALVMTGAAGALGGRAVLTGGVELHFGWPGWLWLACIAVVSTVVAMLAFFAGLKRTGPSTAAILSTFEPVVTTALATLALGETPTLGQLAGGVLVLSSVAVLQGRALPHGVGAGAETAVASHTNPSGSVNEAAPPPMASRCDPVPPGSTPTSLAAARRP